MKYKAVIFDCFGVVVSDVLAAWFRDNLGSSDDIKKEFQQYARLQDTNEMSELEVIEKIATRVGRPPTKVAKEIDGYVRFNTDVLARILALKDAGYKVALLSNAARSFFERSIFNQYTGFQELFDVIVISSDLGAAKPDRKIYEYTLEQLHVGPSEAIFIDDGVKNVQAAEALGIKGVLFSSFEQFEKELSGIL